MDITEVKVQLMPGSEKLKAFVSIKIGEELVIKDLKVIKGNNGYSVAMPSKKLKDGSHRDIIHPATNVARRKMEERVLSEYMKIATGDTEHSL